MAVSYFDQTIQIHSVIALCVRQPKWDSEGTLNFAFDVLLSRTLQLQKLENKEMGIIS